MTASLHAYRTHTCGQLRMSDVGRTVRLSGWVHRKRDHGGLLFLDLRDNFGLTQVVLHAGSPHDEGGCFEIVMSGEVDDDSECDRREEEPETSARVWHRRRIINPSRT